MNPPFIRPTGHEGDKIGVPVPMFAAFDSSDDEQRLMSKAMKRLTAGTSYHGNAGEASAFLPIADRKLKAGGTLALIMPLSLMSGNSWEASRELLAKNYSGLIFGSIAGAGSGDMSFSADTGMGECLIVGRKEAVGSNRATFVVFKERPSSTLLGASVARQLRGLIAEGKLRQLEDGPFGGTTLYFGEEIVGQAMDAPLPASGGWNLARIADLALAQAAHQIINGNIWLPAMNKSEATPVPITIVSQIGKVGPYHSDINGQTVNKKGQESIRGPFNIKMVPAGSVPTYPALWAHAAERETTLMFEGDKEAQLKSPQKTAEREAVDLKASLVWASASHCHFNQNFQFNSQPTPMQFTPRLTIGGRAWPSIQLANAKQEKALVLWANSSLGLLVHWWVANKQQSGRGNITPKVLQSLPILNVAALTKIQMDSAVRIFDDICLKPLLPIHNIAEDPTRRELDERLGREVLGMSDSLLLPGGAVEVLRMKMAQEPSIRGRKSNEIDEDEN